MTQLDPKINVKYEFKIGTNLASDNAPMWQKTLRYSHDISDKELVFKFELAGKTKENIKIFNENKTLIIKIEEKDSYKVDLDFFESVDDYDLERIKATMKNGLLTIKVPKLEHLKQEIEIE